MHSCSLLRMHAPAGNTLMGTLAQQASTQQELGPDVSPLNVTVQYLTASIMRVKIGAAGRWEVPMDLFDATPPQGEHRMQAHRSKMNRHVRWP